MAEAYLSEDEVAERLSKAFDGDFEAIADGGIITCPGEWSPAQIANFKAWWDATTGRTQVRFVPHGLVPIRDSKAMVVLATLVDAVAALAEDAPDRWQAKRLTKSARERMLRLMKEPEGTTKCHSNRPK